MRATRRSPPGTNGPAITPPASTPAEGLADAIASARNAMQSANWRQAIDAWTSVLAIDAGNAEAKAGLKQAQAMLDQASTIDNVQEDFSLRRERLKVQFQDDMVRSNSSYDQGDYRKARENAVTARLRVDRDRGVLPPDQYASMMKQIDTMLDRVAAAEQLESLAKDEAKREEARSAASAQQRKEKALYEADQARIRREAEEVNVTSSIAFHHPTARTTKPPTPSEPTLRSLDTGAC